MASTSSNIKKEKERDNTKSNEASSSGNKISQIDRFRNEIFQINGKNYKLHENSFEFLNKIGCFSENKDTCLKKNDVSKIVLYFLDKEIDYFRIIDSEINISNYLENEILKEDDDENPSKRRKLDGGVTFLEKIKNIGSCLIQTTWYLLIPIGISIHLLIANVGFSFDNASTLRFLKFCSENFATCTFKNPSMIAIIRYIWDNFEYIWYGKVLTFLACVRYMDNKTLQLRERIQPGLTRILKTIGDIPKNFYKHFVKAYMRCMENINIRRQNNNYIDIEIQDKEEILNNLKEELEKNTTRDEDKEHVRYFIKVIVIILNIFKQLKYQQDKNYQKQVIVKLNNINFFKNEIDPCLYVILNDNQKKILNAVEGGYKNISFLNAFAYSHNIFNLQKIFDFSNDISLPLNNNNVVIDIEDNDQTKLTNMIQKLKIWNEQVKIFDMVEETNINFFTRETEDNTYENLLHYLYNDANKMYELINFETIPERREIVAGLLPLNGGLYDNNKSEKEKEKETLKTILLSFGPQKNGKNLNGGINFPDYCDGLTVFFLGVMGFSIYTLGSNILSENKMINDGLKAINESFIVKELKSKYNDFFKNVEKFDKEVKDNYNENCQPDPNASTLPPTEPGWRNGWGYINLVYGQPKKAQINLGLNSITCSYLNFLSIPYLNTGVIGPLIQWLYLNGWITPIILGGITTYKITSYSLYKVYNAVKCFISYLFPSLQCGGCAADLSEKEVQDLRKIVLNYRKKYNIDEDDDDESSPMSIRYKSPYSRFASMRNSPPRRRYSGNHQGRHQIQSRWRSSSSTSSESSSFISSSTSKEDRAPYPSPAFKKKRSYTKRAPQKQPTPLLLKRRNTRNNNIKPAATGAGNTGFAAATPKRAPIVRRKTGPKPGAKNDNDGAKLAAGRGNHKRHESIPRRSTTARNTPKSLPKKKKTYQRSPLPSRSPSRSLSRSSLRSRGSRSRGSRSRAFRSRASRSRKRSPRRK